MSKLPVIKGYTILGELGHGAFGKVYKIKSILSNQLFAAKLIVRENLNSLDNLSAFEEELRIHQNAFHPNICQVIDVIYYHDYVVIILEYCEHGDLLSYIHKNCFSGFDKIMKMFVQLIEALKYLHDHKIFHGDVKLENLLLDGRFNLKLADFGCAQSIDFPPLNYIRGTIEYFSPELIKGKDKDRRKSDIWACGIILYTLLANELPYSAKNEKEILEEMTKLEAKINKLILPGNTIEILKMCLTLDEDKRPDADAILKCLETRRGRLDTSSLRECKASNSLKSRKICKPSQKRHSLKLQSNSIRLDGSLSKVEAAQIIRAPLHRRAPVKLESLSVNIC